MKNTVLLLILSFSVAFCMEEPPRSSQTGKKRLVIAEPAAPAPKYQQFESKSALEVLPNEIKNHILSFLTTAKGATKRARLDNAAENIRSFFRINTSFKSFGDDPQVINYIITELANRYAEGDKMVAAIALGTEAAGKWLKEQATKTGKAGREAAYRFREHFKNAAKEGRINVVKFLYEFGPEMYADYWYEILKIAVRNNRTIVTRFLLSQPKIKSILAQIINQIDTSRGGDGMTLLMNAAQNDNLDIIKLLLDERADINVELEEGETALWFADYNVHYTKNDQIVKFLKERGAQQDPHLFHSYHVD